MGWAWDWLLSFQRSPLVPPTPIATWASVSSRTEKSREEGEGREQGGPP